MNIAIPIADIVESSIVHFTLGFGDDTCEHDFLTGPERFGSE